MRLSPLAATMGLTCALILGGCAKRGHEAPRTPRDRVDVSATRETADVGQAQAPLPVVGDPWSSSANVSLVVNFALARQHPALGRAAPLFADVLRGLLRGAEPPIDPMRDIDWLLIFGRSLADTRDDVAIVRYDAPDATIDDTVDHFARGYDKGGPYDVGVTGLKASLGHVDDAQRVFVRPQSKLLVITPPSRAHDIARTLREQTLAGPARNEAARLVLRKPSQQVTIRWFDAAFLSEVRVWMTTDSARRSVDVFAEADCTDEAGAAATVTSMTTAIERNNEIMGVRIGTGGLLNGISLEREGAKVRLHMPANAEQIGKILKLVAAVRNVTLPPTQ